jgi:hypothetical protein
MGWARWLLLGDLGQQLDIDDLQEHVERMRNERDLTNWDIRHIREVADELLEMQLRHGLLVRLLIAKGVISAEEYASLVATARVKSGKAENPESSDTGIKIKEEASGDASRTRGVKSNDET